MKNFTLANTRLNRAYKLANDYKCIDDLFDFLIHTAHQHSREGQFQKADKLFKEAFDRRNALSKKTADGEDNKHTVNEQLYKLYYDWGRNYIATMNLSKALDHVKESHYIMQKDPDAMWLTKALILCHSLKKKTSGDEGELS